MLKIQQTGWKISWLGSPEIRGANKPNLRPVMINPDFRRWYADIMKMPTRVGVYVSPGIHLYDIDVAFSDRSEFLFLIIYFDSVQNRYWVTLSVLHDKRNISDFKGVYIWVSNLSKISVTPQYPRFWLALCSFFVQLSFYRFFIFRGGRRCQFVITNRHFLHMGGVEQSNTSQHIRSFLFQIKYFSSGRSCM